jgi:hydroxymethylpyrimidine/phosphomethylpyrimidine kinase
VALTVAGSDSGGGAGIQADLKTFAALGVHGTSAITCLTAQNPRRVLGIEPASPKIIQQQIEAVFAGLRPAAVKTGMLYSAAAVRIVAEFFSRGARPPLVVDPVMISTSGAPLLQTGAVKLLRERLIPVATLVTPNVAEAEALTGLRLRSVEDLRAAARAIHEQFGCAGLVKGGHLRGTREAADIYYDGGEELLLTAPFIRGMRTHGTGCTYSAAITAWLARGVILPKAVARAKQYITDAIAHSRGIGKHTVLGGG